MNTRQKRQNENTNPMQDKGSEMNTNQAQDKGNDMSNDYLFGPGDSSESLGSVIAFLKVNKHNKITSSYGEGLVLPAAVEVQVIEIVPNERRTFYKKVYTESDNKNETPDCFSLDGLTPSVKVANPKSSGCLNCPMNAWGSAKANGLPSISADAKACKTHKRIIVLLNVPQEHELYGVLHVVSLPPKARDSLGRVLSQVERTHKSYLNGIYKVTGQMMSMQFEFSKLISRENADLRRKLKEESDKLVERLTQDAAVSDVVDALPLMQEISDQPTSSAALPLMQETSGQPVSSDVPAWVVEAD